MTTQNKARGAYDAIVYIEGSEVVAEDSQGRKIASGVAGTNDATVLLAACNLCGSILIASDLTITSDVTLTSKTDICISSLPGVTITRNMSSGNTITIDRCHNVFIEKCIFTQSDSLNSPIIHVIGSTKTQIRHCVFHDFYYGIYAQLYASTDVLCEDLLISKNEFYNYSFSCVSISDGCMRVTVSENSIHDTVGDGLIGGLLYAICTTSMGMHDQVYAGPNDLQICNNHISNHAVHNPIDVHGGNNILISGNILDLPEDVAGGVVILGIYCHNVCAAGFTESGNNQNWIISNNIIHNGTTGIFVANDIENSVVKNVVISGNIVNYVSRHGIVLYATHAGSELCDVTISNNVIENHVVAGDNGKGIWVQSPVGINNIRRHVMVSNNVIDGKSVYVEGIKMSVCEYSSVIGNTIRDCTTFGINCDSTVDIVVSGNRIIGGTTGIKMDDSNDDVIIGNRIASDLGIDVDRANCEDTLVSGNILYECTTKISADNATRIKAQLHNEHFQDCLIASATSIRSNEDLSAATPLTFTLDAQPDVPRRLTWAFDAHANITAFSITFTGINAKGISVTQTITEADGWSGVTNEAFAVITSIIMTARTGTGAGDTIDIGVNDVVGLGNSLIAATDVFKVTKNAAHMAPAGYTVEAVYDTVDLSTGGAITGGDDFTIWYQSL